MPAEAKNRFRLAWSDRIPILSPIGGKSVPAVDHGVIPIGREALEELTGLSSKSVQTVLRALLAASVIAKEAPRERVVRPQPQVDGAVASKHIKALPLYSGFVAAPSRAEVFRSANASVRTRRTRSVGSSASDR